MKAIAPRATLDKYELFKVLGYEPHRAQRLIHDAGPHDGPSPGARLRWVSSGVRLGKTTAAAMEIVAASLAPTPRPTEFWCAAPTHSLADRTWRAVVAAFTNHLPEHVVRVAEHDGELVVRSLSGFESLCLRRSTERPISLVGAGVDGMVIDEASGISDEAWENGLSTRILDKLGWVLAISSPRGCRGWWYRGLTKALKGDDPQSWGIKLPTWASPLISRDELRAVRDRVPEWVWRQEYCGEPVAADGKVFDPDAIARCATGRFRDPIPGESYLAGLDIGSTNDRTVLVVARAADEGLCEIVKVHAWGRMPFEQMGYRVRAVLRRYGDAPVRVDETGLGAPVLQQLIGLGIPASGVTFTAASKNAMVRNLSVLFERGRIVLPMPEAAPLLHDELAAFEYLDSDSGSLGGLRRMGSPGGQHDDHVAALLLASSWFRGGAISGARLFAKGQDVSAEDEPEDDEPETDDETETENLGDRRFEVRGSARVDYEDDDEPRRRAPVRPSRFDLGHRFGPGGRFGFRRC